MMNNRFYVLLNIIFVLMGKMGSLFFLVCYYLLIYFLFLRTMYTYKMVKFLMAIIFLVLPLFLSLLMNRIKEGVDLFFSSLIPSATPLWISFFVGLAESVSYMVRPFVLIIRPFLNMTMGSYAVLGISNMCINSSLVISGFLMLLFFYEVFVAIVHWFMVVKILGFSVSH